MRQKLKLFLDYDSTIVNSVKRVVEIINEKYGLNKNPEDLTTWNFRNLFPMLGKEELLATFESDEFFNERLEFISGIKEMIEGNKDNYDYNVVTIGTTLNLVKKSSWIRSNLPEIKSIYGLQNNIMSKLEIDMSEGILVDDNINCLRQSNAKIKILFKNNKDYSWNKIEPNEELYVINSFDELDDILKFYTKVGEII